MTLFNSRILEQPYIDFSPVFIANQACLAVANILFYLEFSITTDSVDFILKELVFQIENLGLSLHVIWWHQMYLFTAAVL